MLEGNRIVIKVGSSLMIGADNLPREDWLQTLVSDIAALRRDGKQVIVVTSGAVALGRHVLKLGMKPLQLEEKQAAAASGQIALIVAWREAFAAHNIPVAQLLLTADDSEQRRRYLNARATLETLLELGAIPVINENDSVATQELRVGDNDRLSARVAAMVSADMLLLLSDVDGLYKENPQTNPKAEFVAEVKGGITPAIEAYASGAGSLGTGGMATKLQAARIALAAGCHMLIAQGHKPHPLKDLGRHTRFTAEVSPLRAKKKWISGMLQSAGSLMVDGGAAKALTSGKSLLPAGVTAIEGEFERGDAVLIRAADGTILGRGLTAYASADARRIIGRQSNEIETILGFKGRVALIHRDDLVLE